MSISQTTVGRPSGVTIDDIDRDFLLLITKGYPTSYAIWSYLKTVSQETGKRLMVYKNVNRRILILAKMGLIEEIRFKEKTPHRRIEYKLTMNGMEQLIPYFLVHPKEVKGLVEYMDIAHLSKSIFALSVLKGQVLMMESIHEFEDYTRLIYFPVRDMSIELGRWEDMLNEHGKLLKRLITVIHTMVDDMRMELGEVEAGRKSMHSELKKKITEDKKKG